MAAVERRDLAPDEKILSQIFPGTVDLKPTSYRVISNSFDTCTFSIEFEISPLLGYPKALVVRLEASKDRLATVVALQRLAHAQLSDVVPPVLHVDTTATADGRPIGYCVTAYCTRTIPLEDLWDTLDEAHQLGVVDSVVDAMEKLQKLGLDTICQRLTETPFILSDDASQPVKMSIGVLERNPPSQQPENAILHCKLLEMDGGIALESAYEDIGRIELSRSDLDDLQHRVVFCHKDVEPRNILVRKLSLPGDKGPRCELVAIIDSEMACFYPFAYAYGHKDTVLGSSNQSWSWYALFKQRTSYMVPRAECHAKIMKAVTMTDKSKKRRMTRNVGIRFQEKWMDRKQVDKSTDPRQGWVRVADAEVPGRFTKDDKEDLELEVLKELGYT